MSASTTSLVGVLKKKMLDTKEEVERVKEQIQDMASAMEAEVKRRDVALSEVTNQENRLAGMEDQLAQKKDMAREANAKTTDLGKESEESLRVARVLKNKNNTEDGQVAALEKQLQHSVLIEKESEAKYEEVIRKLQIAEAKLEQVDKRVADNEVEKVKLEDELKSLCSNLKSVECSKDKAFREEESSSDKIKIMEAKCKEVEGRADLSERNVEKLQEEADRLEAVLGEVVTKNKKVEEEMEAAFQDLRNM